MPRLWAILVAFGLFLSAACIRNEPVEWTDAQMVQVIVDIHLAEAAAQNLSGAIRDTLLPRYYEQVFTIHRISEAEFDAQMEVLQRDPERLQALYQKVDSVFEARSMEARER